MSSEKLASAQNVLKGNLAGAWDILSGDQGQSTDLGIARRFGGAAIAYSLRDIGAMNGRVIKVRRPRDDEARDFSAGAVASGGIEQFVIGQDILDLYNKAAHFPGGSTNNYFNTSITLSGAFTISFDVVFTADAFGTNDTRIFQDTSGNDLLTFTANNTCKFRVGSDVRNFSTLSTALELYRKYSMIFSRDGSGNYTLTVDGAAVATKSSSDTDDFTINRIGFRSTGALLNININSGQHIFAGDGADNSNWLDTGSGTTANATKVGTVNAFTGQNIDAFVDTWYDQSGNGFHMTQDTNSIQPNIIKDGALLSGIFAPVDTGSASQKVHLESTFDNQDIPDGTTQMTYIVVGENITSVGNGNNKGTIFGSFRGVANYVEGQLGLVVESSNKLGLYNGLTTDANVFQHSDVTTSGDNAVQTNKVIMVGSANNRSVTLFSNDQTQTADFVKNTGGVEDLNLADSSATDSDRSFVRIFAPCRDNSVRSENYSFGTISECILYAGADGVTSLTDIRNDLNSYYQYY
tara:strand:+ start:15 stop:1577 length:1563 start_codon:yes stop_codon:yes gene_type:complete